MTSTDTAASVGAFIASYRAAFERADAAAIADHFAYPAHVTSEPGEAGEIGLIALASHAEWARQLERLLAMYRAIDVRTADVRALATVELSPRLVQSTIHWQLRGASGEALYDFDATYTLAKVGGALRIAALAHNELPRYRACLARLHAEPEREGR